jgi:hypothetical protein
LSKIKNNLFKLFRKNLRIRKSMMIPIQILVPRVKNDKTSVKKVILTISKLWISFENSLNMKISMRFKKKLSRSSRKKMVIIINRHIWYVWGCTRKPFWRQNSKHKFVIKKYILREFYLKIYFFLSLPRHTN